MVRGAFLLAAATAAFVTAAVAAPTASGGWFRVLPGGVPGAGYVTLSNTGATPIALISASTPGCGMLMLHKTEKMGGMAHMSMVERIEIAAHGSAALAPGGYHLMCMNPTLKIGTTVSVTLQFSDGSQTVAPFAVRDATGK